MDSIEILTSYGFNDRQTQKIAVYMRRKGSRVLENSGDITSLFDYFKRAGYSKKEIISIFSKYPELLCVSLERIRNKVAFFTSLGLTKSDIHHIVLKLPQVLSLSEETIAEKIAFFEGYGISKKDAISICRRFPQFMSISKTNICDKIAWCQNLGITSADAAIMFTRTPSILGTSLAHFDEIVKAFKKRNYSDADIAAIVLEYPGILGFKLTTLDNKLDFIEENGLKTFTISRPTSLMQSVELTKARLIFLENSDEYRKKFKMSYLFLGNYWFEQKYHVSKEQLIANLKAHTTTM